MARGGAQPRRTPPAPAISLLEIRVPRQNRRVPREHWPVRADVATLTRAAERLAPERLVLALPRTGSTPHPGDVQLPCFHRAASIVMESLPFVLRALAADGGEFAMLLKLCLLDCIVVDDDLGALLSRCPRLRVLQLRPKGTTWRGVRKRRTVHSATLLKLIVDSEHVWLRHIDIVAPMLKQLRLRFPVYEPASISISASMLEKVSWHCWYEKDPIGFGLWGLRMVRLETAETPGQLPSLQIYACNTSRTFSIEEANLAKEIEKHMVLQFSDLELHLSTMGHVFGAFVLHLLEIKRIRSAIRRLMVIRHNSQEAQSCPANCPCEPTDWRTQIIPLTALEEVEMHGFEGEDHDYDFLKLILSCAPMLRRIVLKLSDDLESSNVARTKIDELTAYFSVECIVYVG
ncbi:unnamed protein product [Alopecurus aequalis]